MKKRILVIPHYFYPDVASTAQLATELFEGLQDDFEVTVIASFPVYSGKIPQKYKGKHIVHEKFKDINILRVKVPELNKIKKISRIKGIISYCFYSLIAIMISGRQDIVFAMSQPPIIGGILGVIGKRLKRAKFIYNIQDFNPEQTEAVGYLKNRLVIEFARKIDKHSCRVAEIVVVVGRDMQETLNKRFNNKNVPSNVVINNWIDETKIYPLDSSHPKIHEFKDKYGLNGKYVFMNSGNIGLYYDLENVIKVIGRFKDREDIIFAFVGDGVMKKVLVDYCKKENVENVRFIPYQDKEELIYSLNAADVHIVTNAKGIKGVSVSSKIYGVMSVGKPVLGILEKDSEARILIEESNCGVCCNPGEYQEIEGLIEYFIDKKDLNMNRGIKGRLMVEKQQKKSDSIDHYKDILHMLTEG